MIPVVVGTLGTVPKRLGKGTGRARNQKTSRDYLYYSIGKIGQNIDTSPADLRRLAVSQTQVKNQSTNVVTKNTKV